MKKLAEEEMKNEIYSKKWKNRFIISVYDYHIFRTGLCSTFDYFFRFDSLNNT